MQISLSEEDRERIGCPEWFEMDADRLSLAEAEQVEVAGGDWTSYRTPGLQGFRVRLWVALNRIGLAPEKVTDIDVNMTDLRIQAPSLGKAPSAKSAAPMSSTSARSGRRTRKQTS